ncbi:unnamed protein product [Eruca vesicaria subsp. sativa]|uniref:Uncharacterized protein n=1 Tax=Eruca vesicaria subsp. sativa TaxID=29727 RepID=A0ABC8LKR1_ERUVS|nr:unnamed protein product [Eruca vesicaria subsp. sativa]
MKFSIIGLKQEVISTLLLHMDRTIYQVETFTQFGVVFLCFLLSLEFSTAKIAMENIQLSDQEAVVDGQCGSSLQVSADLSLINKKSVESFCEEDDALLSEDDASVSEFEEEYELANIEDQLETEDIDALETNNENEQKDDIT